MARLPLLRVLLPFALGIAGEDALGWPPSWAGAGVLLAATVWALRGARVAEPVLGVCLGAFALALRLHAPVPEAGDTAVVVDVLESPRAGATGCRLLVWVHGPRPGRALLRSGPGDCDLLPGQRLLARVALAPIRPASNPGGADPRRQHARRGVHRSGRLLLASRVTPEPRAPSALLARLRTRVGQALDPPERPSRAGALLRALVTGDRAALAADGRRPFAESGTAHLLAVSGLHVAWVFGMTQSGVGWLLRRSRRVAVLRRARVLGLGAGVLAAVSYAVLSGLGVPALRACGMALAGTLALAGGRPAATANALVAAAVAVLALDPASLFAPGLWLSFSAVAGILLWSPPVGRVAALAHATLAASLATAPWVAAIGAPLPRAGLVANVLAIPLFAGLVVPLGLGTGALSSFAPGLAGLLLPLAQAVAELGIRLLEGLASDDLLRGAAHPRAFALLLAGVGFGLRGLALRRPVQAAGAGGLALLALGLQGGIDARPAPSVLALDVGHGDAILVRSDGRTWLVDAGPSLPGFDAGRRVVLPALRAERVARLDALVITHSDRDHLGGAAEVIAGIPVGEVWLGERTWSHPAARRLRTEAARRAVPLRVLHANAELPAGAERVSVLWPPAVPSSGTANDASLVLRFAFARGCALLPGDVPARVERALSFSVESCALLVLAHHGSRTSSDARWLERLDPLVAVASSGLRPSSPLPHASVRDRLRSRAVSLYETARTGALRVRFTSAGPVAEPFLARPWRAAAGRSLH